MPVVLFLDLGVVDELLVSHPNSQDCSLRCSRIEAKFDARYHTVIISSYCYKLNANQMDVGSK